MYNSHVVDTKKNCPRQITKYGHLAGEKSVLRGTCWTGITEMSICFFVNIVLTKMLHYQKIKGVGVCHMPTVCIVMAHILTCFKKCMFYHIHKKYFKMKIMCRVSLGILSH